MTDDTAQDIEIELYSIHLRRLHSLNDAAQLFRLVAWVILVLSIIGGGLIAVKTNDTGFGTDHPYIALGIATAFSGVVFALSMNLAAIWALAWVAARRLDTSPTDESEPDD